MVGTSGSSGERAGLVTAAREFPSAISAARPVTLMKHICTCP